MLRRPPSTRSLNLPTLVVLALIACLGLVAQTPDQQTVRDLLRAGGEAVRRGDLKTGEDDFQRAADAAPNLSDVHLALGMVRLREGNLEGATQSLRRAIELNPRLPGAHLFLGIAEYQQSETRQALDDIQAEVSLSPDNVEALTWQGIVELGVGNAQQAITPLDRAAALSPKDESVLYYRGRAHQQVAEESYRALRGVNPDSALLHRALGDTLANSGQPEKAIDEYEAAIRKQPANPDLYESLAEQDQKLNRIDAATSAYETELKLNPSSGIALYNLGMIDVQHGKPAEGVALLRRAQDAHALEAPTDFYLGLGLAETGDNTQAAHWLERSLASSPSPFIEQSAYYQLARVYQRLNRRADAQHAIDQLQLLKSQSAKSMTGAGEAEAPASSGPQQ